MFIAYRYRLLPTKRQHEALTQILEEQRQLYNAALEERIDAYRKTGRGRTYYDQDKALTEWRQSDPEAAARPREMQSWTLKRVDHAYEAFFRRLKAGRDKVGFPRFRGMGRWSSFGFRQWHGIRFDGSRVRFNGMPSGIRVHMHREMPACEAFACTFKRTGRAWHVCFEVKIDATEQRPPVRAVGIDVGLTTLAALSDGSLIPNPRQAQSAEREMRRRQRALARCKRGSKRRAKARDRVARLHRRVTNARSTYLHQVSADLVARFDVIAVENLNVKGMARGVLAKSVHDAAWGRLREYLAYKAEKAGARLIEVNPRHTSQTCPECGQVAAKDLKQRTHACDCGCVLDRDVAAARVILGKAIAGLGAVNVAGYSERAPGNLAAASAARQLSFHKEMTAATAIRSGVEDGRG